MGNRTRRDRKPNPLRTTAATICEKLWRDHKPKPTGSQFYRMFKQRVTEEVKEKRIPIQSVFIPAQRTVEGWLAEIWPRVEAGFEVDKPWELGSLVQHPEIPADAVPDLFAAWKLSLALGRPLTVRQAQWIARLRPMFAHIKSPNRIQYMLYWGWRYATREYITGILEGPAAPVSTADLDAAQALGFWQGQVAQSIRAVPSQSDISPEELVRRAEEPDKPTFMNVPSFSAEVAVGLQTFDWQDGPWLQQVQAQQQEEGLSEESEWIYAICLQYLGKAPKWNDLPIEDRKTIARQLKEWSKTDWRQKWKENLALEPTAVASIPPDLLRSVGYEVPENETSEKTTNESREE
ncbi:MAG: hypothetical protein HYX87_00060 [Chloroflexi bacterium]|nr:hypothetical protein [Chloroflexota bacterium]